MTSTCLLALSVAMSGIFFLAGGAVAQTESLLPCGEIADDSQRLDCFDRAYRAAITPPPPADHIQGRRNNTDMPTDQQALKVIGVAEGQRDETFPTIDILSANIVDYAVNADGKVIFFLDNKQIWKQVDSRRIDLRRDDLSIELNEAAFGAYRMKIRRRGKTISSVTVERMN